MPQVIKKENIVISAGEYQKDGQTKQEYRTIGELITMQGDDGSTYQFGKMWGPTGSTNFNVYDKEDRNQQGSPQQAAPQQAAPQGQPQQAPQSYAQPQQAPAAPYGQPNQPYQPYPQK